MFLEGEERVGVELVERVDLRGEGLELGKGRQIHIAVLLLPFRRRNKEEEEGRGGLGRLRSIYLLYMDAVDL